MIARDPAGKKVPCISDATVYVCACVCVHVCVHDMCVCVRACVCASGAMCAITPTSLCLQLERSVADVFKGAEGGKACPDAIGTDGDMAKLQSLIDRDRNIRMNRVPSVQLASPADRQGRA